jgi:putative flippase GtrA
MMKNNYLILKNMAQIKKADIISPLVIGEIIALIALIILNYPSKLTFALPSFVFAWSKYLPLILPLLCLLGIYVAKLLVGRIPVLFQLAKFVLVGASNTFVDLGILNILMLITGVFGGVAYSLFKAISFICSVINSYFWNKFWTFEKKETKVGLSEFGKFFVIAGIGFFLNVGIASLVVNIIGPQFGLAKEVWANVGAFLAILVVFMWNFSGYKFIVFKK